MGNQQCNQPTNYNYQNTPMNGYPNPPCPNPNGGFISRRIDRKIARREAKAMRKPYKEGNLRKLDRLYRAKNMIDGNSTTCYQQPQNYPQQQIIVTQQQIPYNDPQQVQYSNQQVIHQPVNPPMNTMLTCAYCRCTVISNDYQNHLAQCSQKIYQGVPVVMGNNGGPAIQQIALGSPISSDISQSSIQGQSMMTSCQFCYQQVSQESLQIHMNDCNYNPQIAKRYY